MRKTCTLILALLLCGGAQAAQLYRWVDDKGRVEWRDTPPPPNAKKVERRSVGGSVVETSTLPFSVQQAMQNFPLVLYVTDCGEGCTKAREHLNRRGLPYTERNPQDDFEAFRKLTDGRVEVPLLFVGRQALRGYEQGAWDTALDAAGYPRVVIGAKPQPKPAPEAKPPAAAPAGEAAAAPAAGTPAAAATPPATP
ncbi:MAG: glutaredoxin family protein [Betaproteobacteria bacterium]|nr:glutaredoxin family protein [Betaproteobacteria bacterium]